MIDDFRHELRALADKLQEHPPDGMTPLELRALSLVLITDTLLRVTTGPERNALEASLQFQDAVFSLMEATAFYERLAEKMRKALPAAKA